MPASPKPSGRASVAALLSALIPGLGYAYLGRSRRAYFLFVIDFLIAASALVVFLWFRFEALRAFFDTNLLIALLGVNLVLFVYRGWAVIGAYRAAPQSGKGVGAAMVTLAAAVLVVVPHLVVASLVLTQHDLITSVFQPPPVAAPSTTTTDPTPTSTAPGQTTSTTTPPTTTTTAEPTIWDGLERLNIALLGSDMRPDQEDLEPGTRNYLGHRTDIMIVVSINPRPPYDVAILPVPRFLSNFEMPEGFGVPKSLDDWDWIGHVWRRAEDIAPERYPGPGRPGENAVKTALGELLGLPIHYYALVTVGGFIDLVDAFGGVDIDIPRRIVDRRYDTADNHFGATRATIVIEEGRQRLDGYHALAYARIRSQSHEYARMHRQRCVVMALIDQSSPFELLRNFGSVADAIKNNVLTDIPQDRLVDFIDLLPNLSTDQFTTLQIDGSYEIPAPNGSIRYYDLERIRNDAQLLVNHPEEARITLGLTGMDTTCEGSFDP